MNHTLTNDRDDDVLAPELANDLAAFDADLFAKEGPNALTTDSTQLLAAYRNQQSAELLVALNGAERDSDGVGFVLATFRQPRGRSREQLADWLRISEADLGLLASEQRVRAVNGMTQSYVVEPINELADRVGAHRTRLYEMFDQGDQ